MLTADGLSRDIRFALRTYSKTPVATAVIVLTLALGIAATSVSFSLVNTLFGPSSPIRDADRFVRVYQQGPGSVQHFPVSFLEVEDLRGLRGVFEGAAGEQPAPFSLAVSGASERAWGEIVSDGYFPLFGIQPALGRFFNAEEEAAGEPAVVLSYAFWQRRFGGDPRILDEQLRLDGRPFRVAGIAPDGFRGTIVAFASDMWMPARSAPWRRHEVGDRAERSYFALARLAPGVTAAQARAAVDALGRRLQRDHPATNRSVRLVAFSESEGRIPPPFNQPIRGFSALAVVVALLVTAIACANVAGLLLARAAMRRREIAVRLAVGASRAQVIAQLLTEAGVLAAAGGVLGVSVAWLATGSISALQVPIARGASASIDVTLNATVLAGAALLSAITGLLFGLTPALDASRTSLAGSLKDAAKQGEQRRSWARRAFLAAQVAIAVLLLAGTALFLRNLQQARAIDLGFDPAHVVTTAVDVRAHDWAPSESVAFWQRLIEEIRRMPGTESASLTARLPLELGIVMLSIGPDGFEPAEGRPWPGAEFAVVEADYFRTLKIPILTGRDFTDRDGAGTTPVIILNDVVAEQFWGTVDVIGRYVINREGERYQVVGVVRRSKYFSVGEDPKPYVYFPLRQGASRGMTIVARSRMDASTYLRAIGDTVRRLDALAVLHDVKTMSARVSLALAPTTGGAVTLGSVGLMALGLTALGLFGTVAQNVSRRTYEIGVRRALGAQDRSVVALVVREIVAVVIGGVAAGLAAAIVALPALRALLYRVDLADPLVFGAAPATLLVVAMLAAWLPAHRATRIDAASALRHE